MLPILQYHTSINEAAKSTYQHIAGDNREYPVRNRTVSYELTDRHSQLYCTEVQIVCDLTMFTEYPYIFMTQKNSKPVKRIKYHT